MPFHSRSLGALGVCVGGFCAEPSVRTWARARACSISPWRCLSSASTWSGVLIKCFVRSICCSSQVRTRSMGSLTKSTNGSGSSGSQSTDPSGSVAGRGGSSFLGLVATLSLLVIAGTDVNVSGFLLRRLRQRLSLTLRQHKSLNRRKWRKRNRLRFRLSSAQAKRVFLYLSIPPIFPISLIFPTSYKKGTETLETLNGIKNLENETSLSHA